MQVWIDNDEVFLDDSEIDDMYEWVICPVYVVERGFTYEEHSLSGLNYSHTLTIL